MKRPDRPHLLTLLSVALLSFAGAAAGDEPVRVVTADLAGLVWAAGAADCGLGQGSDLLLRQCRGVKTARARSRNGRTFVVTGDGAAAERAPDGLVTVRGCLACAAPVDGLYVVTRGSVQVQGDRVLGPVLRRVTVPGAAVPAVTFTFRLDSISRWTQGGKSGVLVDLVDATVAGEEAAPAGSSAPDAGAPAATPSPALPEQPTPADVKEALAAVTPDVERCFERYGVPGTADLWLELAGDGEVSYAEVRGPFFDTPTGACVAAAAKKARFPRFHKAPMRLHYPFLLR